MSFPSIGPFGTEGFAAPNGEVTRRRFLQAAAASAGAIALAGCADTLDHVVAPTAALNRSGGSRSLDQIDHVVVVMMENRSFDHLLGWHPGADGRQANLRYRDANGVAHLTHALAPDFQGCGFADPDHSFDGGRIEYDGGRCDGWLRAGQNDIYSIGYYQRRDLALLGQAAVDWTTFDRYFCAILGPTFPNRIYQHAAQTDRLSNTLTLSTLPTIWDRLYAKGVSGRYYFTDLPVLALWGNKYLAGPQAIRVPIAQFYADCAAGTLPSVSFVDPAFVGEDEGTSNDDHPHGDVRVGEAFLNQIYSAITQSPIWTKTALIIRFDEWGGFFDHVPPPAGPVTAAEQALGYVDGLRGFRIPVVLVSPFARRQFVSRELFDHTSILKLIETRWGLPPLGVRDAAANNLADALSDEDDDQGRRRPPQYVVPTVVPVPCPVATPVAATATATGGSRRHWSDLRTMARGYGWPV